MIELPSPVPLATDIWRWGSPAVFGFQMVKLLEEHFPGEPELFPVNATQSVIRLYHASQRLAAEEPVSCAILADIECLWIGGGNAASADLDVISDATGKPAFRGPDGAYSGEAGGLAILREENCRGMVCDLGQGQIKITWAGRRWIFPRNLAVLPLRKGGEALAIKGAQRRNLRSFIALAMRCAVEEAAAGLPEGVVLALPSELDKWGQPAGSTYIAMARDTQLGPDALELAGFPGARLWLLNDAELAAYSALQDSRIWFHPQALVVTLGTAIGAAVADPIPFAARLFPD